MKRIGLFLNRLFEEIRDKVGLDTTEKQSLQTALQGCLKNPSASNKEDIYKQAVQIMIEHNFKDFQIQPILDILYNRYFSHFELIEECERSQSKRQQEQQNKEVGVSQERVVMNVEAPYICKPLKQSKQIIVKKGVALDPTYID